MTQLNPFAIGEQKPRQTSHRRTGLEINHATYATVAAATNSLFAAPGQGPPPYGGRVPWLNAPVPPRRTAH